MESFSGVHLSLATVLASCLFSFVLIRLVLNYFTSGLSDIPGDFLGKCTDAWRLWKMYRSEQPAWVRGMLKKYKCSAVRVGPKAVYVADPSVIDIVYSVKDDYVKVCLITTSRSNLYGADEEQSDQVGPWVNIVNGQDFHSLADARDHKLHSKLRRPIQGLFNTAGIMSMEDKVDDCVKLFVRQLDAKYARNGAPCDIHNWIQYFAFEVTTEMTMSRKFGFLEEGRDIDGILRDVEANFYYRALTGNMPWLDYLMARNPLYLALANPTDKFSGRAMQLLQERFAEGVGGRNDFLDRFVEAKSKNPETVDDATIAMWVTQNLLAGSDTTSVVIRSAVYYLARYPKVLARLRKELDGAGIEYPISYKTAESIPYVDGTIKESWRIQAVGGFFNERVVPESGLRLADGTTLPPGTVVGLSRQYLLTHKRSSLLTFISQSLQLQSVHLWRGLRVFQSRTMVTTSRRIYQSLHRTIESNEESRRHF